MMKSPIMALLIMTSFLLIAGRSSGRLPMKTSLFIAPDNPSAFDPNLNSFIDDESTLHTPYGLVKKDAVVCDQEIRPWRISSAKSATNQNKVSFRLRLSPSVPKTNKRSADKFKGVFNVLPKGAVTPSGPSPRVNSMVTEQRLSSSSNSPGVGHMQRIRPKSLALNGDILESHHSHGDDNVQKDKKNKRKLGSAPSPGRGH